MKTNIRFVKLANRWFAFFSHFDDGDIEDLEMVGNASKFLDDVYNIRHTEPGILEFEVSDEEKSEYSKRFYDFILAKTGDGAEFEGEVGETYKMIKSRYDTVEDIWLCPVLRWFFCGEYPEKIFIKIYEKL